MGLARSRRLVIEAQRDLKLNTCLFTFEDTQRAFESINDVDDEAEASFSSDLTDTPLSTTPSQPADPNQDPIFRSALQRILDDTNTSNTREDNVSDSVWGQLCTDRAVEDAKQELRRYDLRQLARDSKSRERLYNVATKRAKKLNATEKIKKTAGGRYNEMQTASRRLTDFTSKQEEERTQREALLARVRSVGTCPKHWNWRWIRQVDGYRCEGGGHFVAHEQLPVDVQGVGTANLAQVNDTKVDAVKGDEQEETGAERVNKEQAEKERAVK